jgi:hypothetical protein
MRRLFLNIIYFLIIVNYFISCNNFGIRRFWIINKNNQDIRVELIFKDIPNKKTVNIFSYYGFGNCSNSFPEGVVPTKIKDIATLKSNQCLEIGLCESSSNQVDKVLNEYEHNLKRINLYIGDSVKTIYPENFSKIFKTDCDNFYAVIE